MTRRRGIAEERWEAGRDGAVAVKTLTQDVFGSETFSEADQAFR